MMLMVEDPRWNGEGQHEISSFYSGWHAISNLWFLYFWHFPYNIFRSCWPRITETWIREGITGPILQQARSGWLLRIYTNKVFLWTLRKSWSRFVFHVEIKLVSAFWNTDERLILKIHWVYHKHTLNYIILCTDNEPRVVCLHRKCYVLFFTENELVGWWWFMMCACVLGRVRLFATPWTIACQAPLSVGFPRQEYWSGLPFPLSGYLHHPGIDPTSLASLALSGAFFTSEAPVYDTNKIKIYFGW